MLQEKEAAAAKYTPSGKRKFKATVISTAGKSGSIFGRTATTPPTPTSAEALEKLKFRKTEKDYRATVKQEPTPFAQPSEQEPEEKPHERERHLPKPGEEFKPTTEDFRKKKE